MKKCIKKKYDTSTALLNKYITVKFSSSFSVSFSSLVWLSLRKIYHEVIPLLCYVATEEFFFIENEFTIVHEQILRKTSITISTHINTMLLLRSHSSGREAMYFSSDKNE